MASITYPVTHYTGQESFQNKTIDFDLFPFPRRCMVISTGLLLTGLLIAALMLIEVLPATLLLGFVSLALIGTGGTSALYFYGEI